MTGQYQAGLHAVMLSSAMSGYQGPVYLALRPSASLRRALLVVHVSATLALLFYPSSWPRTLLCGAIVVHAGIVWYRLSRPGPQAIVAMLLGARNDWHVMVADGRVVAARMLRQPYVSPYLTALSLQRVDGRQCHIVLLPDNVDGDAFRRLRVRLRREFGAF